MSCPYGQLVEDKVSNGCLDCVAGHPLVLVLVGGGLNEESIFALRRPHSLNPVLQTPALSSTAQ